MPIWRSLHGVGIALQVLLWVGLGVWFAHLAALANQRSVVEDASSTFRDVTDADDVVAASGGIAIMVGIAIFVLIVIWAWRGAKNLEVLGRARPTLGPGWAIGSWFIPLAWWIMPALVLHDTWRGADTTVAPGHPRWKDAPGSPLLVLWWLAFAAGGILGLASGSLTNDAGEYETLADFRTGNALSLVQAALICVAAGLAAIFVRRLTTRMDRWGRHLALQGGGGSPTPPPGSWPAPPSGSAPPPPLAPPPG